MDITCDRCGCQIVDEADSYAVYPAGLISCGDDIRKKNIRKFRMKHAFVCLQCAVILEITKITKAGDRPLSAHQLLDCIVIALEYIKEKACIRDPKLTYPQNGIPKEGCEESKWVDPTAMRVYKDLARAKEQIEEAIIPRL